MNSGIQRVSFVGKLPFDARPLRGGGAKNKRRRKKYRDRLQVRRFAAAWLQEWVKDPEQVAGVPHE